MMEQTALILIIVTLFLLLVIVGLLSILIYRMFKTGTIVATAGKPENHHPDISKSDLHPGIVKRIKELEKIKPKRSDLFCPNHSEEPGEVMCAICDKIYCKSCIKSFKTLQFCKEHLPLVMRHDWEEIVTVKTATHDPERGVRLYDFKKEIFEKNDLPTYIETHYKINVDSDYIETYLVMYAMKESTKKIKNLLPENILT